MQGRRSSHAPRGTDVAPIAFRRWARARPVGMLALAGIAAVWLLASCGGRPRHDDGPLARLASAAAGVRVGRARLSGAFSHSECHDRSRPQSLVTGLVCESPPPWEWPGAAAFERVGVRLKHSANGNDATHRHAVGLWHLLVGDAAQAVAELRAASRLDSLSAAARSDLAAAYLALAESADDPGAIALAYVAAESALALDSSLAEARFNHALTLERLFLRSDAIDAWNAYLAVDSRSPWAREARARRERLSRPAPRWADDSLRLHRAVATGDAAAVRTIVNRFPSQVRGEVFRALAAWARGYDTAEAGEQDQALRLARALAIPLAQVTGNTLPAEATGAIDEALARRDRARLDDLVAGHRAFLAGRSLVTQDSPDREAARAAFADARDRLGRARSPFALWAEYHRADAWYREHHPEAYAHALDGLRLVRRTAPARYLVVRSTAARTMGLIHHVRANYDAAMAAYDSAFTEGRETKEPDVLIRPRSWIALIRSALTGERAAWREFYRALELSQRFPEAHEPRYSVVSDVANQISLLAPRLATRFRSEAVRAAGALADSVRWAYALLHRAELAARSGDVDLAVQDLDAAQLLADGIRVETTRSDVGALADLVAGQVYLPSDPQFALARLRRAADMYRRTGYDLWIGRAHVLLAEAFLAAGQTDSAEVAFERAIVETERQRDSIEAYQQRAQFLDRARPVFDDIARFHAGRDEVELAFDYVERMRARMLLEHVVGRGVRSRPLAAREVRSRLPDSVNLVSYAVLDDELLVWVVRAADLRLERVPVAASRLAALVDRLETAILDPTAKDDFDAVSGQAYEILIQPVEQWLDPGVALVLIPDKWLHFVPFAALRDLRSGRFLVQDRLLALAPSAALFIEAVERSRHLPRRRGPRVLAIGNPLVDGTRVHLPDLPGARREAVAVADAYGGADLLLGPDATEGRFRAGARHADVIHFAGHGVLRTDAPLQSYLMFATESGKAGGNPLYARDLFEWRLDRTRLAVLSGCHTAGGALSPTEGASSLARAFFAAGVPAVVASLWAVEDEQTADFFAAYHQRLTAGDGPAGALRDTQLEWIGDDDRRARHVATWAAFQLFGWGG